MLFGIEGESSGEHPYIISIQPDMILIWHYSNINEQWFLTIDGLLGVRFFLPRLTV